MTIVGVDPGLSGALAFYEGGMILIRDMPTRQDFVNRKLRNVIAERALVDLLRERTQPGDILVIEQVSGMPGQSGPAAFTFGYGVGVVTAAALSAGLTLERVHPSTWKAALGLKTADKSAARALAAKQFPTSAHLFARVKDDGRAEAALIAWWGWLTRGAM